MVGHDMSVKLGEDCLAELRRVLSQRTSIGGRGLLYKSHASNRQMASHEQPLKSRRQALRAEDPLILGSQVLAFCVGESIIF